MSATEVLAAHQWSLDSRYYCLCGKLIDYQSAIDGAEEAAMSAHVLDELKAIGYLVVDRNMLVDCVAASTRADLLIAPDELFLGAKATAASGIDAAEATNA